MQAASTIPAPQVNPAYAQLCADGALASMHAWCSGRPAGGLITPG